MALPDVHMGSPREEKSEKRVTGERYNKRARKGDIREWDGDGILDQGSKLGWWGGRG